MITMIGRCFYMKAETKKVKRGKLNRSNSLQLYSMCIIPMLQVLIFKYLPIGGIILAFKRFRYDKGIFGSPWVGFKNFEFFFKSDSFWVILRNTLGLNALFIVTGLVSSIALAIVLYRINSRRATKVYQTILITPHFVSWVIASYVVYAFLNPSYGLMNSWLTKMGMEAVDWYSTPGAWPVILTIASIWKHIGMDSIMYYAALMGMDSSLIEAASVDGATKWQQTRHVIIPQLMVLIVIKTILKIGGIFHADFGLFYQLTRDVGALYSTTDVIDTFIFRTMRVIGDMGMSSAVGLLQSIVGFIMVVLTNYASKKFDEDFGLF